MGDELTTLINEINSVSDVFNKNLLNDISNTNDQNNETKHVKQSQENPVEEIVKLLNLHLENLKYIEKSEATLKEELSKINRTKKIQF